MPPTIVIRPGQPFNVFLTGDVSFDGPYVPAPIEPQGNGISALAPAR